jgi:hypothetical protein
MEWSKLRTIISGAVFAGPILDMRALRLSGVLLSVIDPDEWAGFSGPSTILTPAIQYIAGRKALRNPSRDSADGQQERSARPAGSRAARDAVPFRGASGAGAGARDSEYSAEAVGAGELSCHNNRGRSSARVAAGFPIGATDSCNCVDRLQRFPR